MDWSERLEEGASLALDRLEHWFELGAKYLPNLAVALVVLLLSVIVAKVGRMVARRAFNATRLPPSVVSLFSQTVYLLMLAVGVFIGLSVLQLDKAVTSLLAGLGIAGLAISFAFQDLATNFVSGVMLIFQRPLRVGDLVMTQDLKGYVKQVGLRATEIRDLDGQTVFIPSKEILQSTLINYSKDAERRVNLEVGVAYDSDLVVVERACKKAVEDIPNVLASKPVQVHWQEFGGSSINLTLRFWISKSDQASYNEALSAAVKAITASFRKKDVNIPFPIRTLDFGDGADQLAAGFARALQNGRGNGVENSRFGASSQLSARKDEI